MKLKQRMALLLAVLTFSLGFILYMQLVVSGAGEVVPTPLSHETIPIPVTSSQLNKSSSRSAHQEFSSKNVSILLNGSTAHVSVKVPPAQAVWALWRGWVQPHKLYPESVFYSEEMGHILHAMATEPITSFGLGHKGTQLKATAMLGTQRTAFKPKR